MSMKVTVTAADLDPRRQAMYHYWQGLKLSCIARMLGVKPNTLYSWKQRDGWDNYSPLSRVELTTSERYCQLVVKDVKTDTDLKELDALSRQMERQARITKYEATGKEADLNPNVERRHGGKRKPPTRNAFTESQLEKLESVFFEQLFEYQKIWYRAGHNAEYRIRNILKSRQIGATWYFAREALLDAMQTGRDQIFLSASKAQAHVFKNYILAFAQEADLALSGDPIKLPNGAKLYFLGTSSRTAQSYTGNLYFDEYFWVPKFQTLRKVASGMAMQSEFRQTYFSTPSTLTHEAYPFWSGEAFNVGRPKGERIELDVSAASLVDIRPCEDAQLRQVVTIENALARGFNRASLEQLRREYPPEEFRNLLLCEFIDDSTSVFPFEALRRCMVDAWEEWSDFQPLLLRPFGYRPVWIGYDPNGGNEGGDSAGCVVIAPPDVPGGPFRVLERHRWDGNDYEAQAKAIKGLTEQYHVEHIAIDVTGIGDAVWKLVSKFFPAAHRIQYSVEVKTNMVLKALNVIRHGRLAFDAGHTDIAQSFMAIRKVMTASGRSATYAASRSGAVGHADLAWAVMHVLFNEPLEGNTANNGFRFEVIG